MRSLPRPLLLLLAAAPALAGVEAAPVPAVEVRVVERPAADSWVATYRFAEPVPGLVFLRDRGPERGRWRLTGEGAVWGVVEGQDAILVEGEPVREIAVEFPSDFRPLVKQYELNLPYTDGGRLLYTGHLAVRPLGGERIPDHRWRFATAPGRNVVVLDREGEGELERLEPAGLAVDGTYAYFGPQSPVRGTRMSSLADPGLPGWMRVQVEELLPRLVDRYAEITGVELDFRPLVLLSYHPSDASGLTFLGGTLDGLVQMAAEGRAWERPTPEATSMWVDRTAHEIFHFWTGQMFSAALGGDEQWITEGGADHHALGVALDLGLLDAAAYRRRLVERANDCMVGLAGRPIFGASERGDFSRLYSCGSILWCWASKTGQAASGDGGEHAFVRALLAAAGEDGRRLTTYRFLQTLHELTGSPWAGASLARLLFQGVRDSADVLFLEQMRAAGLEVELVTPAEAALAPGTRLPEAPDGSWSRLLRPTPD